MVYPLSYLADRIKIRSVTWDVQRNDQLSGAGDGRVWQAELAPPLWLATIELVIGTNNELKQIAALIRRLHGSQEKFLLSDPLSMYPQSDPDGSAIGASNATLGSVGSDRASLSLVGLPASFKLLPGDKMAISYGSNPMRNAFLEVSEEITANASGVTDEFAVFPHIPTAVAAGLAVTLAKPACQCVIFPGSHSPGTATLIHTEGAGFKAIQKR